MAKHILSKSTYIKGLQCHKALFLTKHFPEWRDKISAEQKALFNRGHKVGELAQQLFPKGKEIVVKKYDYAAAQLQTQQAIAAGITTLYEATFIYNGTLVMIDILIMSIIEESIYLFNNKSLLFFLQIVVKR